MFIDAVNENNARAPQERNILLVELANRLKHVAPAELVSSGFLIL
jgi:hypothetical protein